MLKIIKQESFAVDTLTHLPPQPNKNKNFDQSI